MDARKFFLRVVENWPAKVLSLALAIILFIFYRMSILETRLFFNPLIIENLNSMMPSSPYPRMIRVSLKGEADNLHSILEDDIETFVDMEEFSAPGAYKVPIRWRKKGTALGVEPLQISVEPMEINLSLDYKISKFVPLSASFSGQVDAGYNMTSYTLDPNQVIVEGPASLMGGISMLQTELIELAGHRSNFSVTASILNRDPLIVIRGDGMTEFSAAISQIIPIRNIPNAPIAVTGVMEGFSGELDIKTVNLHMEGSNRDAVEMFVLPSEFIKVDCSGIIEPGTYILQVITGTVAGIRFRVDPEEVAIHIGTAGEDIQ